MKKNIKSLISNIDIEKSKAKYNVLDALVNVTDKQKMILENGNDVNTDDYDVFTEFKFPWTKAREQKEQKAQEERNEIERQNKIKELHKTVIEKLIDDTGKPMALITSSGNKNVKPDDSYLGGKPGYLPADFELSPKEYCFLGQINCKDITCIPDFPKTGILSFWVIGCFDRNRFCDGKCFYFEDTTKPGLSNDILNSFNSDKFTDNMARRVGITFKNTYVDKINFINKIDNIFSSIYDWETDYVKLYNQLVDENGDESIPHINDTRSGDIWAIIREYTNYYGDDKCGGYDTPIQDIAADKDNDTVLLQLGSEEDFIIWGDWGNIQFYISNENLKKKNFDKTQCYWSCS